jgi:hypothetical protein
VLFVTALLGRAQTTFPPTSSTSNVLAWDAVLKAVDLPAMTNTVHLSFWVTNISQEDITLL